MLCVRVHCVCAKTNQAESDAAERARRIQCVSLIVGDSLSAALAPIDSAIDASLNAAQLEQTRADDDSAVASASASDSASSAADSAASTTGNASAAAAAESAVSTPLSRDSKLLLCLQRALVCHVHAALAAPVGDAAVHSLALLLEAFSHSVLRRCDQAFATLIARVESVTPSIVRFQSMHVCDCDSLRCFMFSVLAFCSP